MKLLLRSGWRRAITDMCQFVWLYGYDYIIVFLWVILQNATKNKTVFLGDTGQHLLLLPWRLQKYCPTYDQHDRQCRCNVTSRSAFQRLLQWKSNKHYICRVWVCNLCYSACNTHLPSGRLWSVGLQNNFQRYLINGTIFEKKNVTENKMCVLISSTNFVWKISNFKQNWVRYDKKCVSVFV